MLRVVVASTDCRRQKVHSGPTCYCVALGKELNFSVPHRSRGYSCPPERFLEELNETLFAKAQPGVLRTVGTPQMSAIVLV